MDSKELKKISKDLTHSAANSSSGEPELEDLETTFSSLNDFVEHLAELGMKKMVDLMSADDAPAYWYPSSWEYTPWGKPYPKILARALVQSDANESITDLTNIYYSNHSMSPEAIEVFQKDVLSRPKDLAMLASEEYFPNGFFTFAEDNVSFVKSMIMLLSDKHVKEHIEVVRGKTDPADAAKYFKLISLDPKKYGM